MFASFFCSESVVEIAVFLNLLKKKNVETDGISISLSKISWKFFLSSVAKNLSNSLSVVFLIAGVLAGVREDGRGGGGSGEMREVAVEEDEDDVVLKLHPEQIRFCPNPSSCPGASIPHHTCMWPLQ